MRRRFTDERGQLLPALLLFVAALVTGGLMLFQVGGATAVQAGAQTGADAAALAAAENVRQQLYSFDQPNPALVNWVAVRAAADDYAARNDTSVVGFEPLGLDVRVTVSTDAALQGVHAERVDVEGRRGEAVARARVVIVQVPLSPFGGGESSGPVIPPPADAPEFVRRAWEEANRIDGMSLPYLWGGGHQSSPAPANGPFDCSGSVSRVLQAAGLPIPTMVSGQFVGVGQPGPGPEGGVRIYANDGHVYMSINGRFFGTGGQNPGGGAGWLDPYSARPGFVVRHIPLNGDFVAADAVGSGVAGSPFSPATFGGSYEVQLVPLGG